MRDVQKLYAECLNELKSIGIEIDESRVCSIEPAALSNCTGQCLHSRPDKSDPAKIQIAKWLLNEKTVTDVKIPKSTIIHELIHVYTGEGHTERFIRLENKVTRELGYDMRYLPCRRDFSERNDRRKAICPCCGTWIYIYGKGQLPFCPLCGMEQMASPADINSGKNLFWFAPEEQVHTYQKNTDTVPPVSVVQTE